MRSVLWFRRDLRLHDHPALNVAAANGPVLCLFVLDPVLLRGAGSARLTYLLRTLKSLQNDLRGIDADLVLRAGRPWEVVPTVVAEINANSVHITADFAPYGAARDFRVAAALGSVPLIATGTPYAVAPGEVRTSGGGTFQVFTPFHRAWLEHGWPAPAPTVGPVEWLDAPSGALPAEPHANLALPPAGEDAALEAWAEYRHRAPKYAQNRDRVDINGTTGLSAHLKLGTIHPRTLLATMAPGEHELRRQLAWREFFAAALCGNPTAAHAYVRSEFRAMPWVRGGEAKRRMGAWEAGRTGYPIVDAAMRQLLHEGRIHNRARMIAASFLVKDLGVEWTHGAAHFLRHLIDADVASNQLSWQWVAGTGFDAAPYYRIFNPVTQSRKFDPNGEYLRRWLPELRELESTEIHEPWALAGGPPNGYPLPIVDHHVQRRIMLAAYDDLRRAPR